MLAKRVPNFGTWGRDEIKRNRKFGTAKVFIEGARRIGRASIGRRKERRRFEIWLYQRNKLYCLYVFEPAKKQVQNIVVFRRQNGRKLKIISTTSSREGVYALMLRAVEKFNFSVKKETRRAQKKAKGG